MSKKHATKHADPDNTLSINAPGFNGVDIYVNGSRFIRARRSRPQKEGEIDVGGKTYIAKSTYNGKVADLTQKLSDLEKSHAELTRKNAQLRELHDNTHEHISYAAQDIARLRQEAADSTETIATLRRKIAELEAKLNADAKLDYSAKINPEELSGEVARSWLKNVMTENKRLQKKVDELEARVRDRAKRDDVS